MIVQKEKSCKESSFFLRRYRYHHGQNVPGNRNIKMLLVRLQMGMRNML